MEYDEFVATIDKLPNASELKEALNGKIHALNTENAGWRLKTRENENRVKQFEELTTKQKADLEEAGFDPKLPIKDQLEKLKSGLKPSSDFDALSKKMEAKVLELNKKFEDSESARAKAEQARQIETVRNALSLSLKESFGPNAQYVDKILLLESHYSVKDGAAGIVYDEEFVPQDKAMAFLKAKFPELAMSKQTSGGKGVNTTGAKGTTGDGLSLTIEDFEKLPIDKRIEFSKNGGQIVES
jgi:hypothetical protein